MGIIANIHSWEYTNEFDDGSSQTWYGVAFNYTDKTSSPWNEIGEWCIEQFGYPERIHNAVEAEWSDCLRFGEVAFKDPRHVPYFILRWS